MCVEINLVIFRKKIMKYITLLTLNRIKTEKVQMHSWKAQKCHQNKSVYFKSLSICLLKREYSIFLIIYHFLPWWARFKKRHFPLLRVRRKNAASPRLFFQEDAQYASLLNFLQLFLQIHTKKLNTSGKLIL